MRGAQTLDCLWVRGGTFSRVFKERNRVILLHRSPLLRATLLIIDTPRFIRDRWGDIKEVGKSQERTNPSFGGTVGRYTATGYSLLYSLLLFTVQRTNATR